MKTSDPRGPIVRKAVQPRITAEGVEAKGYKAEDTASRGKLQVGKGLLWDALYGHFFTKERGVALAR